LKSRASTQTYDAQARNAEAVVHDVTVIGLPLAVDALIIHKNTP